MPRDLTPAVETLVTGPKFTACGLFEGIWPGGEALRLTNGLHNLVWDNKLFLATGGLLGVEDLDENADLKTQKTTLKLSLPDQAIFAQIEAYSLTGIPINIWQAFLDEDTGAVVPDPILLLRGFSNGGAYDATGDDAVILLEVTDEMANFDKVKGRRTNHTEQMAIYPGDRGFAFVASQAAKGAKWASPKFDA